jgi:NADH:ubiquinone oxidoreductase subunit 3 (subunit A)
MNFCKKVIAGFVLFLLINMACVLLTLPSYFLIEYSLRYSKPISSAIDCYIKENISDCIKCDTCKESYLCKTIIHHRECTTYEKRRLISRRARAEFDSAFYGWMILYVIMTIFTTSLFLLEYHQSKYVAVPPTNNNLPTNI